MIKEEDLVVLMYSSKTSVFVCSVKDVPEKLDKYHHSCFKQPLEIDLEKRLWSWEIWRNQKIGSSRKELGPLSSFRHGIIGVYDKNNNQHLTNMTSIVKSATKEYEPDSPYPQGPFD